MTTKTDRERKADKASAVTTKIEAMAGSLVLVSMLDEWKLDLLLIALGDGEVVIRND